MHSMMSRALALAGALLFLFFSAAAAMETPDNDCFSPGLVRLSVLEAEGAPVFAQAEITVDHAAYARDLSVLASMLSGTTFEYERAGEREQLRILRGGETLSGFSLTQADGGAVLEIGGRAYACDEKSALQAMTGLEMAEHDRMSAAAAALSGVPILERVPLASVAAWLEGLAQGDALLGGFVVSEPFVLERTMSDDGTRLTRVDVLSGGIAREGEAPYTLSGHLRQPAGRAPKDTFELVLAQDEKNFIELSYSALRENEVTRRDRAGTASVRTTLKAAGKIAGSRISSRLTVTMKNAWTADEALSEKITISASLEHQDNRPGMRMLRLNSVNASLRNAIRLTTKEQENDVISLSDEITLEMIMDGNTFLAGGANVRLTAGGRAGEHMDAARMDGAQAATPQMMRDALREEIIALSSRIYPHLSEAAKQKVADGL